MGLVAAASGALSAQRGRGQDAAPPTAKATAPIDLTGYWVSIVTEDWRYRMVTPARGDHPSVPLNAAGNALANRWDPAKDEAAGEPCKAYGAAGARGGRGGGARPTGGNLKVVTTKMKPGYLQKNGVPYSANAVQTEYFNRTAEPNGDSWLILTAIVDDPQYLNGPFIRSTHYKRLPDTNTAWEPEPCSAK